MAEDRKSKGSKPKSLGKATSQKSTSRKSSSHKVSSHKSKEARRKALLARLSRVEGQIRAVRRMIAEGQRCELVAQQLAASRTAMNKAFCEMMACAFEHELDGRSLDKAGKNKLEQLTDVLTPLRLSSVQRRPAADKWRAIKSQARWPGFWVACVVSRSLSAYSGCKRTGSFT